MMVRICSLSLRYNKVREEDRQEISMIEIIIREVIKIEVHQIVEIGECHSVVEYSMNIIIEIDQGTIRITEVHLEEDILEEMCYSSNLIYRGQNYRGGYRGNEIVTLTGKRSFM